MSAALSKITIRGYRSILDLSAFPLDRINLLIGANGAGKSNFVSFFHLLREIVEERLQLAVNKAGGADSQLFLGPQVTKQIEVDLAFGENGYAFTLEPTADNRLVFSDERIKWSGRPPYNVDRSINRGRDESELKAQIIIEGNQNKAISQHIYNAISSWVVYHFHDTSDSAAMRRTGSVRDNERLRSDGGNMAAFLLRLRTEDAASYRLIIDTIRLVAPFFEDFTLRSQSRNGDEAIDLEWRQVGSDFPLHPHQLSDGTVRFIGLATALLQPSIRPRAVSVLVYQARNRHREDERHSDARGLAGADYQLRLCPRSEIAILPVGIGNSKL